MSIIWMTATTVSLVLALAMQNTQKKNNSQKEKSTQFECGFNSMTPSHIPFSYQFFLIALLFLIFDVEIALILSFPMEASSNKTLGLIFLFLTILIIGLFYEWQKGKIKWSEWMGGIFFASKSSLQPQPF